MAEADWAEMTSPALDSGSVARGVTNAFTRVHADAGSTVFGFHALTGDTGFAGLYVDLSNFNPIAGTKKGGSIRAALKRYSSGAGYAPMFGLMLGTDPNTSEGYMLGLTQATSYAVALKKGSPGNGMDDSGSDLLRLASASDTAVGDSADVWKHLRLDVLVNPHGEVVLNVYENDAQTNGVTAPVWSAITGMDQYIDDSLGILSGSLPHLTGFYAFFGHYTEDLQGSVSLFDHIEVYRQTSP